MRLGYSASEDRWPLDAQEDVVRQHGELCLSPDGEPPATLEIPVFRVAVEDFYVVIER